MVASSERILVDRFGRRRASVCFLRDVFEVERAHQGASYMCEDSSLPTFDHRVQPYPPTDDV